MPPTDSVGDLSYSDVCAAAVEAEPHAGGDVPVRSGAVGIWLCGDLGSGGLNHPMGTRGPQEPLIQNASGAVLAYERLRKVSQVDCAGTQTQTFSAVFVYDDGQRAKAFGDLGGCGSVGDGQTISNEGARFLEELLRLWTQQRSAGYVEPGDPVSECATASMIEADPSKAVSAMWCSRGLESDHRGGGSPWLAEGPIPTDVLLEVVGGLGDTTAAHVGEEWNGRAFIMLEDSFGDVSALQSLGAGRYLLSQGGSLSIYTPSPDLAETLDSLRGS